MKQIAISLLSGTLILAACRQVPAGDAPSRTATPVITIQGATETSSPTPTSISVPTETPTASITPLPTIPTFTSTFDVSTIVTVTPAAKAKCPKEDLSVVANFPKDYILGFDEILAYLNSGGTLDQLAANLSEEDPIIDLTGDSLSEVIYKGLGIYTILGCKDGKYENLFEPPAYVFNMEMEEAIDLNGNGIPELISYNFVHYGYAEVYIFEWDGNKFRSLIDIGEDDWVLASAYHKLIDINGDNLKEIAIVYDVNEFCDGLGGLNFCDGTPAREQTTVLAWNGQNYVDLKPITYEPPQYHFQAIQDGDLQARYGYYAKALSLYQAAIFDDRLEWWSPEREVYEIHAHRSQFDPYPTTSPPPVLDKTEYPRLAAYAYYRIMLLHIVQEHESDAGTVYKTLQQKFGDDPSGRPYVEMATAFWEAYQSTDKMYDGCAAAIQYAAEHPEILIPLGSDYHGSQSHTYVPADVCPFR